MVDESPLASQEDLPMQPHCISSMLQKFTLCNLHGWRNCQHRACIGKSFLASKRGSPSPCEAALFFLFFFTCSVPGLQPWLLALLSVVFVWQHWLHTPGIYGVGKGEGSGVLGEQHLPCLVVPFQGFN